MYNDESHLKVPENVFFKKIKLGGDPEKLTLIYDEENTENGLLDTYSIESRQDPHPDFTEALRALGEHLRELCEQGDEGACKVSSISLSWKDGIMGVVISGSRSLANSYSPLQLNSPHKTVKSYSDNNDDMQVLYTEAKKAVEKLILEGWRFVCGKRAQQSLELDDAKKEPETETSMRMFAE